MNHVNISTAEPMAFQSCWGPARFIDDPDELVYSLWALSLTTQVQETAAIALPPRRQLLLECMAVGLSQRQLARRDTLIPVSCPQLSSEVP